MMYLQCLAVPSVLFYVVESTCNPLTVTAEAVRLDKGSMAAFLLRIVLNGDGVKAEVPLSLRR